MLLQAPAPSGGGGSSNLLAGIALVVGACGALAGGVAAIVSAVLNRRKIAEAEAEPEEYPARLWTEILERLDSCEEARAVAEEGRRNELRARERAETLYEECNAERLRLLRNQRRH